MEQYLVEEQLKTKMKTIFRREIKGKINVINKIFHNLFDNTLKE